MTVFHTFVALIFVTILGQWIKRSRIALKENNINFLPSSRGGKGGGQFNRKTNTKEALHGLRSRYAAELTFPTKYSISVLESRSLLLRYRSKLHV